MADRKIHLQKLIQVSLFVNFYHYFVIRYFTFNIDTIRYDTIRSRNTRHNKMKDGIIILDTID